MKLCSGLSEIGQYTELIQKLVSMLATDRPAKNVLITLR